MTIHELIEELKKIEEKYGQDVKLVREEEYEGCFSHEEFDGPMFYEKGANYEVYKNYFKENTLIF